GGVGARHDARSRDGSQLLARDGAPRGDRSEGTEDRGTMTVGAHLSQRVARAGNEALRDTRPSLLLRCGPTVLGGADPSIGDAGGEHAIPVRVGPLGGTERTGRIAGRQVVKSTCSHGGQSS